MFLVASATGALCTRPHRGFSGRFWRQVCKHKYLDERGTAYRHTPNESSVTQKSHNRMSESRRVARSCLHGSQTARNTNTEPKAHRYKFPARVQPLIEPNNVSKKTGHTRMIHMLNEPIATEVHFRAIRTCTVTHNRHIFRTSRRPCNGFQTRS